VGSVVCVWCVSRGFRYYKLYSMGEAIKKTSRLDHFAEHGDIQRLLVMAEKPIVSHERLDLGGTREEGIFRSFEFYSPLRDRDMEGVLLRLQPSTGTFGRGLHCHRRWGECQPRGSRADNGL
jgi:hypothetical protein